MWIICLKSLLNLLQYSFRFMLWFFGCKVCEIWAPPPGLEPTPPALEGKVLTTELPGKSPCEFNFLRNCQIVFQIDCTILHSHPVYKNSSSSTNSVTLGMVSLKVKVLVTQSCPTLCDPPDSSPGVLPDPGIEPGSPAPQAYSLPSEPPGKSMCQFKKSKLAILCSDISLWF